MAQHGTGLVPAPGETDHVRGSLDAPVVIAEFGDFECPYCGDAYRVLEAVLEKYGSRVALVFRNFPLPMHPHAPHAASAAETAAASGKFWEMYAQLFRHQNALTDRDLATYAETIGIGSRSVEDAARNDTYGARIGRDVESAEKSNVEGTPALFINGFAYDGEISLEGLSETIDLALTATAGGRV
jgi:protein-disulfide isomerase